jgi:predicted outer membrane lipoprotein
MRWMLAAVLAATTAFGVVTAIALEGREVVVVETTDAHGKARRTRTWIADDAGSAWIEAANPERPFLLDLRRAPELVVERHGTRHPCRGEVAPNPEGHERIRRLLRARYGWADRWIALVADTHASLAIRLACP